MRPQPTTRLKPMAKPRRRKRVFCTECGADLEEFCFSEKVKDLESIQATALLCKVKGVSSGKYCAKMFIVKEESVPSRASASKKTSKKAVKVLRESILRRIRQERA